MKHILLYPVLFICFLACLPANALPYVFSRLDASDGLSDNQVQHILQLPDGRMVFTTLGNINLYDGMRFHYIHRNDSDVYAIDGYHGHYHVYVGDHERLWVKDYGKVWCLDLRHERYLKQPEQVFSETGIREKVNDLFVDSEKGLWLVSSKGIWETRKKRYLLLPKDAGELQDVEVSDGRIYLFSSSGEVLCYSQNQGKLLYRATAYPESEHANYGRTSLVVKGPDGNFYQVRSGMKSGLFAFFPKSRTWKQLLDTQSPLHTLIVPSPQMAYISSLNGIWAINLANGKAHFQSSLRTTDGKQLQTDLNTIYQDRQQGIWLGTGNRGILYTHPERFKFISTATQEELPFEDSLKTATRQRARRPPIFKGQQYNDVHTDRHGRTWAGTPDGLRLFFPGQDQYRTFYTEDGLPNNFIHAITEDGHGQIWLSTSDGISRLTVNENADSAWFTNYRQEDGTLKGEYRNQEVQNLPDGSILMGGVNGWTMFHPDSVEIPRKDFLPLLISLSLYGEPVHISQDSPHTHPLLPQAPPYVKHFEFNYRQNHIGFDFSALNYAWPTHTYYRYRLIHEGDSTWHIVRPQANSSIIDHKGNLHLTFSLLPPGNYRLEVMASTQSHLWDGPVTDVTFTIHAPWWLTRWAYASYAILLLLLAAIGIRLYIRQTKRRILRRHKEDILLLRIQHLIERCDSYEQQASIANTRDNKPQEKEEPPISANDSDFLNKAVALVEAHLNSPGYTVEQLSKDLCMERSGLYKKLNTLIDKSPSLFIRSIRLRRAADLIRKGGMNMADIAEQVGFSSASYMSKCFQEEFGCRPSEYAEKEQEST